MDNKKTLIKVYCLIIGSFAVGKTTLINRLNNVTTNENYAITTKINITRKSYSQADINKRIEIVYLEFPGKQIYQNLLFEFIKNIQTIQPIFIVGMFDVSNRASLNLLEHLLNSINQNYPNNNISSIGSSTNKKTSPIEYHRIMIGNKIDLVDKRIISSCEGQSKAKMLKCRYMECATQNDLTMKELEQTIIDIIRLDSNLMS